MSTAYLVVVQDYEGYEVKRVYLDRAEAEAFVEAYKATSSGYLEIEEAEIGAPAVDYDGPVWIGHWSQRRKLKGEKQLVMVTDGFTVVVPSAVPSGGGYRYQEYFTGPEWRDLAEITLDKYEEPAVWIDSFSSRQEWWTGGAVSEAAVVTRDPDEVTVRGTSKERVEQLLRDTALMVKSEQAGMGG